MQPVGAADLARATPQSRTIADPYGGGPLTTVPALRPDVAIVHAPRAHAPGNTQIWGIVGEQKEAAFAARPVIVTAQGIVAGRVLRLGPNPTPLPALVVTALFHVP